jgi:TetR/AcrR family transcriptional regulator, cholesterol catabolism regulator
MSLRVSAARSVRTNTKDPELIRDRREQLIRAALEVFKKKGFHQTTVRDIGRAAALTQGTIYNYVRSKEDILFLVCDRVVTEYVESVQQALSTGDARTRLEVALRGIARVMVERRSTILLLYHESHNLDRRALRSLLSRVNEFVVKVEQLVAEAITPRPTRPRLRMLANIVTFLPTMVALRGWALPQDLTHEQYIDEIVEFMMNGLGCIPEQNRIAQWRK